MIKRLTANQQNKREKKNIKIKFLESGTPRVPGPGESERKRRKSSQGELNRTGTSDVSDRAGKIKR